MRHRNVRDLEEVRNADVSECERLSQRLYGLAGAWETSVVRQQELVRQFVDNDLPADPDGGEQGHLTNETLDRDGREERLHELIALSVRIEDLKRALTWVDERRTKLRRRLEGAGGRGGPL